MKIMVISPHPDDETLGAGGTLLKLKKLGNKIFWLNVTDVDFGGSWNDVFVIHRRKQLEDVKQFYQFDGFFNLSFSPSTLSEINEGMLIDKIGDIFSAVEPEWIILPGKYDAHSDHRVVYNCSMACAKSFRAPFIKRIITMEIISETDYGFQTEKFSPNLYVDITDEIDGKIKAMEIYDTEIEATPFPRSLNNIRAMAAVRGAASFVNYAEAFYIEKQLE